MNRSGTPHKDWFGAKPIPKPGDGLGIHLHTLIDGHPGGPRLDTWCVTLPVMPGRRARDDVPSSLHPLAYDALLACRIFRVDASSRQIADHFITKAAVHARAGGQLRALDARSFTTSTADGELGELHGMHLGDGRHQREKIRKGRELLHDLGAWPWVLFEAGKPSRTWWKLADVGAALDEWSELGRTPGLVVLWPGLESPQPAA